jgi:peptidoglycan/xylan/chitin deacetylase (PgdA/CDA1 family)
MRSIKAQTVRVVNGTGFCRAYGFIRSHLASQHVAIIAYHRIDEISRYPWSIAPVTPRVFEREINFMRRRYQVISLEELMRKLGNFEAFTHNTAVITIDDGYRDAYLNAYPVLKRYGLPATVFLTTGHIGTGELFWWDKVGYIIWNTRLSRLEPGKLGTYHLGSAGDRRRAAETISARLKLLHFLERDALINRLAGICGVDIPSNLGEQLILSWNETKEMSRHNISFGAHTFTHPVLTRLTLEEVEREIVDSKSRIEKEVGREVTTFCYPNGGPEDHNLAIEDILHRHGFKCAVTLTPGDFVSRTSPPFQLPRITGTSDPDVFELIMSGLYTDLALIRGRLSGERT